MRSPSAEEHGTAVETWLDHDPAVRRLPGMSLGTRVVHGSVRASVTELHEAGVRCLRLPAPVLCSDAPTGAARALLLVREATSRGIVVVWTAECDDGCAGRRLFHHLYPPERVKGAPNDVMADWRTTYFPSKCIFRRGPGFIEVRDRRFGRLELFTIDEPGHLERLDALADSADITADALPDAVRRDFADAALIAEHTGRVWWLPMRVHRWPFPSLTV